MDKLSKELKNLFQIKGRKEQLNEFKTRIKKEFDIIEVGKPECRLNQISSEYIDTNWDQKINLEKAVIICSKGNTLVIAFSNSDFEYPIIETIKELKLNADYTYLFEDETTGVIVREFFEDGDSLLEEEYESRVFDIAEYDFSKCFKMIYPVKRIILVNE